MQVLAATKQDLAAGGVNVAALEAAAQQSGHARQQSKIARSKTVLLIKNLPFEATEDSIRELFDRAGGCIRVVLPRTRALALVELQDEQVQILRSPLLRLTTVQYLQCAAFPAWTSQNMFDTLEVICADCQNSVQASGVQEVSSCAALPRVCIRCGV